MTRVIRNWKPELVDETPVSPHRYLYTGFDDSYREFVAGKFREFRDAVPYQPGEVVWVKDGEKAKRARILHVHCELDRYGDRREKFQVQFETATGYWGKLYSYTYPGPIQRGYAMVGLAPDMENV